MWFEVTTLLKSDPWFSDTRDTWQCAPTGVVSVHLWAVGTVSCHLSLSGAAKIPIGKERACNLGWVWLNFQALCFENTAQLTPIRENSAVYDILP